jgi:hypothetical protein
MGPTPCPETSVKDYHSTLCNIPEERRSHQHGGASLKSSREETADVKDGVSQRAQEICSLHEEQEG